MLYVCVRNMYPQLCVHQFRKGQLVLVGPAITDRVFAQRDKQAIGLRLFLPLTIIAAHSRTPAIHCALHSPGPLFDVADGA